MYEQLWNNVPKEANVEFPDYTFMDHFGKAVPSYLPRDIVRQYLEGNFSLMFLFFFSRAYSIHKSNF